MKTSARTTLNIDREALAKAAALTGVKEKTALVRMGLEALIAKASAERLAALGGSERRLRPIPRRRAWVVLVDTSVWVEHLRRGEPRLASLLGDAQVLCHPFVVGEIACGHLRNRGEILDLLAALPSSSKADDHEVLLFIDRHRLQGRGLGLIDVHLLASCALAPAPLWTHDAKLRKAAMEIGIAARW
jgi:predicted nucleic acid-binding protein/Arc/MetJ family transcription regulator